MQNILYQTVDLVYELLIINSEKPTIEDFWIISYCINPSKPKNWFPKSKLKGMTPSDARW